jgi:hypothetical protein
MSNYTKSTDFSIKDGLPSGDASKKVRGTELDAEFNAIAVAVGTKLDTSALAPALAEKAPLTNPAFTGTVSATGLVYGRSGAGNGLGRITVSTSAPSGMQAGDIWFQY